MQVSRSMLNTVVCSLLLSSIIPIFAIENAPRPGLLSLPKWEKFMQLPSAKTALLGALFFSWFQLYSRLPVSEEKWDGNPDNKYSVRDLLKIKNIFTKQYWKNAQSVYYNGVVGQCYKSKSHAVGNCGERIQLHKKNCYPHGICGNIDLKVKILNKSTEGLSSLLLAYYLLTQYGIYGPIQLKANTNSKDLDYPTHKVGDNDVADIVRPVFEERAEETKQ